MDENASLRCRPLTADREAPAAGPRLRPRPGRRVRRRPPGAAAEGLGMSRPFGGLEPRKEAVAVLPGRLPGCDPPGLLCRRR